VERAVTAVENVTLSVQELMKLLGPQDFEMLVDLVFTNSGWRRLGIVGKTQKTLDLDLELPSTGERAFVQVKSKTTSAELAKYVDQLEDQYTRMFYVFHSGEAETTDRRVTVIGPTPPPRRSSSYIFSCIALRFSSAQKLREHSGAEHIPPTGHSKARLNVSSHVGRCARIMQT
jgi:hypothetical protein